MKKSKKIAALILVAAMTALALGGCGSSSDDGESTENGDSEKTPHYIVATEPTFPPFDTTDEDGNIVGFDMDLMNAIAEEEGFTVEYKAFEFDSLIPSVQSGNADIIAAGMNAMDPERQEKVDFSDTYYDSALVVVVKADNDTVTGFDTLGSDMRVASQIGTTGADKANELAEAGEIGEAVINNGYDTCMLQLQNGDVDAVIVDKPVAETYIAKQGGTTKIVGEPEGAESYGFAVQKGNEELLAQINDGLAKLVEDGTYDELVAKWFQ